MSSRSPEGRPASGEPTEVHDALLRSWPLPEPQASKRSRGDVLVIGGARSAPGAAQLAGLSALRVGAGRLTLAVASSVAGMVAVTVPESGVRPLTETSAGHVQGRSLRGLASDVASADALLVGPGLDDLREATRMLHVVSDLLRARDGEQPVVVLDAFALGALGTHGARAARRLRLENLVLTPNEREAAVLLGHDAADVVDDSREVAHRYGAVVSCKGIVAEPGGRVFRIGQAGPGLGTSGSGDVLAGAIAGLAARSGDAAQASVWGTVLHARAGESLAADVAPLGFLASEISERLPRELARASQA